MNAITRQDESVATFIGGFLRHNLTAEQIGALYLRVFGAPPRDDAGLADHAFEVAMVCTVADIEAHMAEANSEAPRPQNWCHNV